MCKGKKNNKFNSGKCHTQNASINTAVAMTAVKYTAR